MSGACDPPSEKSDVIFWRGPGMYYGVQMCQDVFWHKVVGGWVPDDVAYPPRSIDEAPTRETRVRFHNLGVA
jgi:hypothetical protein